MNITVLARPDILRECIELLYRYTNHEDTRSVKNELTMKYNLDSPDLLRTFDPIIEIGELVYGQLEAAPDRMAFSSKAGDKRGGAAPSCYWMNISAQRVRMRIFFGYPLSCRMNGGANTRSLSSDYLWGMPKATYAHRLIPMPI